MTALRCTALSYTENTKQLTGTKLSIRKAKFSPRGVFEEEVGLL